jgi:glycosyltransferase involved in cell wall biosynthesis
MFHANLLARTIRTICPVPVVVSTVHSIMDIGRDSDDPRLRDWIYRITDHLSEVTIAVCEAGAERSVSVKLAPRRKLRVIYNGVDTARFHPDDDVRRNVRAELGVRDEFVWLAVGRLMWKKGYENMIDAFSRQDQGLLLIAGAGPQEADLRALAQRTGANVRFLGFRRDIPELMNAADAYLLSSIVEGLPLVLLEAGSCGLPCVATDVGGVHEIVLDGVNGYVAPGGDVEGLALGISRVMALPEEERLNMGRRARERAVTRFDLKAVARSWDELYRELLQSAATRAGATATKAASGNLL